MEQTPFCCSSLVFYFEKALAGYLNHWKWTGRVCAQVQQRITHNGGEREQSEIYL